MFEILTQLCISCCVVLFPFANSFVCAQGDAQMLLVELVDANVQLSIASDGTDPSAVSSEDDNFSSFTVEQINSSFKADTNFDQKVRGLAFERFTSDDVPASVSTRLIQHLPHLTRLRFQYCPKWLEASAPAIAQFQQLKELSIAHEGYKGSLDEQTVGYVHDAISNLANLTSITLHDVELNSEVLAKATKLSELQIFQLTFSEQPKVIDSRAALEAKLISDLIVRSPGLQKFHLSNCPVSGTFEWQQIAAQTELKELILSNARIVDQQLVGLGATTTLRTLTLDRNPISQQVISEILQLRELTELNVSHTQIQDRLIELQSLPHLQIVRFDFQAFGESSWDDSVLRFVAKYGDRIQTLAYSKRPDSLLNLDRVFGGINSLSIESRSTGDLVDVGYQNNGKQKTLRLQRSLSPDDWQSLSNLKKLKSLSLARDFELTARHSRFIRNLNQLTDLKIGSALISTEFMQHLSQNRNLHNISIDSAILRPAAFQALNSRCPWRKLEIHSGEIIGKSRHRLAGISRARHLGNLKLHLKGLRDDDLLSGLTDGTGIANCEQLSHLSCDGTFSEQALHACSKIRNLEVLTLLGIQLPQPQNDLRLLRNEKLKYVRMRGPKDIHFGTIYSQSVANELGFGMAGECSCSCMDVTPIGGQEANQELFSFEHASGVLKIFGEKLDAKLQRWNILNIRGDFNSKTIKVKLNNIAVPVSLQIHGLRCDSILVEGNCAELGLYGEYHQVDLKPTTNFAPVQLTKITLSPTNRLVVHASPIMQSLSIEGSVTDMRFGGEFPRLQTLNFFDNAPVYLSVPHSGSAPNFRFRMASLQPTAGNQLRLLKLPFTSMSDLDWADFPNTDSPIPPLYEVDLRGCKITDATLQQIIKIPTLRVLKINQCQALTEAAIQKLQLSLPNLRIER